MITLTPDQKKVYDIILDRHNSEDEPPTIREIAAAMKTSESLTHRRVIALENKGYITREGYRALRNIRIKVII